MLGASCRVNFDAGADGRDGECAQIAGQLAYYPMDTTDVVDLTVLDRSGNDHTGTMQGSPPAVVAAGRVGEALDYSATSVTYVNVNTLSFDPTPGAAITVTLWFYRAGLPTPVNDVLVYVPVAPKLDLWLASAGELCINTGGGECWGNSTMPFIDRWIHAAVVFKNGISTLGSLYVDGVPAPLTCTQAACDRVRTIMPPVHLGGSDSYPWHGKLDEVRIYDRELSAAEIAQLYTGSTCAP